MEAEEEGIGGWEKGIGERDGAGEAVTKRKLNR